MHRQSVYLLILGVAALVSVGLIMLFSTSAFAQDPHVIGNPYYFLKRQSVWLGVGFVGCVIAARVDYHVWQKSWAYLYAFSAVALALCFVPHIGERINGSARWVNFRVIPSFQPSELAKLAAIAALSWWFARDEKVVNEFRRGFLYPMLLSGLLMGLIAREVDMGSTALIGAASFAIMFVAGTKFRYLVPFVACGIGGLGLAVWKLPERMNRFLAFLYPEKYPADAYQQVQGLIALGSGGVEGLGLGNGRQKAGFLPYAHTDFILPTLGEELGLRFTLAVVFMFILIIMCGAIISSRARDRFGMLLGFGLTVIIALQAALNIGVTTALLPNKGLPLPFISFGGSNLAFCLLAVGILINIYRQGLSDREVKSATQLAVNTRRRGRVRF